MFSIIIQVVELQISTLAGNYNQTGGTHQRGTGTGIQTFNFTNVAAIKIIYNPVEASIQQELHSM
jgi:hypothetical protein